MNIDKASLRMELDELIQANEFLQDCVSYYDMSEKKIPLFSLYEPYFNNASIVYKKLYIYLGLKVNPGLNNLVHLFIACTYNSLKNSELKYDCEIITGPELEVKDDLVIVGAANAFPIVVKQLNSNITVSNENLKLMIKAYLLDEPAKQITFGTIGSGSSCTTGHIFPVNNCYVKTTSNN